MMMTRSGRMIMIIIMMIMIKIMMMLTIIMIIMTMLTIIIIMMIMISTKGLLEPRSGLTSWLLSGWRPTSTRTWS